MQHFIRQPRKHNFNCSQEILLYVVQKTFYLLNLYVGGLQNIRCAGIVIYDGDREDLEGHLVAEVPPNFIILDSFFKLGY